MYVLCMPDVSVVKLYFWVFYTAQKTFPGQMTHLNEYLFVPVVAHCCGSNDTSNDPNVSYESVDSLRCVI